MDVPRKRAAENHANSPNMLEIVPTATHTHHIRDELVNEQRDFNGRLGNEPESNLMFLWNWRGVSFRYGKDEEKGRGMERKSELCGRDKVAFVLCRLLLKSVLICGLSFKRDYKFAVYFVQRNILRFTVDDKGTRRFHVHTVTHFR